MDQQTLDVLDHIRRNIIAAAVLREATRLAPGIRITPGNLQWAVEDFQKVLAEMQKKGL